VFDYGLSENVVPLLKEYIAYDPVTNPLGYNREDTTLGWRAVNIRYTYNGITRENTISVNVLPKQLMGIGMKDLPKIKYLEGDPLDLAGGTVLIFYNNNTTEVLELKNATVNMAGSSFNINAIRFDNSEFGGISKLQTIYVNYIWNNTVFETDFDIIMQDRRYAAVNFNSNNIYEFVYGALNEDNAPQFTVTGYNSFEDTQRALTLAHPNDYSKVTIEYVPYEERLSPRDPFRDYTAIPREVGEYLIVISYDAASYNDRVHNSFVTSENETRIITIRKKKIFVELEDVTKVYGTANPVYNIVAYGTDSAGLLSLTAAPFAFDEDFFSPYFANQEINHGGLCYYLDTPIHYIRIVTKSSTGTVISINTQSSAGNYFVEISAIESGNYDIQYLSSTFIVERREVAVYSNDITVTYGTTSINYTYTTGKVPDGMGGYIQDSGLFGDDLLTGTLMKDGESNSVGKYLIHTGNLGNANYRIIYNPGIEGNKYLTIVKRNIYIKAESYTKIFGTENPDFILEYFSDETCLDSEGAFAFSTDRQQKLGNRGFFTLAETLSPIGHYNIVPVITPYSEEYLDGREDIFGNYNIIYISGILQILPRPLNLTISSASKLYGESDPQEFAYVASAVQGVPESGLLTDIFGNLDELQGSLQRQAGEFVGRYAIEISNLISLNPNYAITYNRADFVIAQKDIYILIEEENLSKIYDGKTPSLSSYRVTHLTNGEYEDYTHNYLNPASISLAFENPSRNIGDYFISVANNNPNYRVQFPEGSEYYYTITPREVNISYVDLPDMQEYRGTAYTFYAVVNDSDIQYQYNADGSIRTDDNNRELKDTVEVTLTAVNALNAADYAVSPVRLSDPNYVLSEAARVETSFTILKRELVIEVLTANDVQADDDGITYEAIYDNMSVILFENEHYVVHNALTQIPILINVRVVDPIHPDEVNISPQNVRYTSDFQEIISYDITAEQPTNNNFTVRMQKEYKFKILPRRVAVTMTEMMLTKQYDNTGPSIDSSMFHIEDMQTSLDFNTISFEFTRSDQTRSNTEVGIYEISIFCSDRNHIVETLGGRIYTYTITKRAVNVALNADALTKVYDGTPISFRQENITYTGMAGIQPNVKSFSDPAEIDAMQAWFDYLAQEVLIFRNLLNINFQNKAVSKGRIEDALSAASVLRNKYLDPQSEQYITPSNYTTILNTIGKTTDTTGTDSVIGRLKEVLEYFDHADYNIPDAQAKFRIATALVDALYNATDSERSYIAFRIEGADANNIDVGSYKITMIYNDYNRSYTFLNAQVTDCYYYITIWEITLRTDTVISTYGEVVPDSVPYTIWHNDTQIAPDDPRINILGKLVVDFRTSPYRVGEFDIIADGEMSDNVNYFINVAANKFVVTKAVLTIKLNEHIGTANDPHPVAEEKIIYYGDSVGINRLKYWDVEGLVAPQPGMPVDTRDVINDQPAVFTAMVNGLNIIDPLSRPDAGTYSIEASGFLAANYTFEREVGGVLVSTVVPGKITINKKALEIASTLGVLDRNYGTPITLNYIGFEYGEDVAVLGANFAQPLPTNPNSPAFNLLTPVSFDEYEVSFYVHPDDADQFTNYVFDVDDKYYRVRVNRAELTMRLVGTGLNGSLTAEYGSDPQYQVIYEGFKNDESHSVYPVFDFQKEVRDTVAFGESNVLAYTELANYTLRIASVPYSVTPKNLYVSLIDIDEDLPIGTPLTINTVYDPLLGNAYVGPYRTQYHYDIATIEDPETGQTYEEEYISLIEILRGQYWKNNFHFVGFAYEDTADNLFSKYSYNDDNYFEYTALYEHNITTTGNIGEGLKYSVSGLNFMYYDNPGQSGNDPANYNLIYQEMDLNIYLKASALLPNGDLILLEGDAPETLTVKTIMENGQINILTLDNEYLVYDESGSSYPMSADENGVVYVKYSRSFSINRYIGDEYLMPEVEEDDDEEGDDPGDPGDPGDEEGAPISSLIEHNILNETEYFNIFVRLHKKDTVTYNGELKDES
ncbi:MAG: MBG domain-containing protein, partial [Clostridia bacterium]